MFEKTDGAHFGIVIEVEGDGFDVEFVFLGAYEQVDVKGESGDGHFVKTKLGGLLGKSF